MNTTLIRPNIATVNEPGMAAAEAGCEWGGCVCSVSGWVCDGLGPV
jgi:hypothetical protein